MCDLDNLGILRRINKIFQINYLKLADRFSVTQILDAWVSKPIDLIFYNNQI